MTDNNNSTYNLRNSEIEFTPPYPLKTAVLFLIFNRIDTTKQVFEAIRQAKPPSSMLQPMGQEKAKLAKMKK
jgi:hypothetical protein